MIKIQKEEGGAPATGATVAAGGVGAPHVSALPVTDATILGRGHVYSELLRQTRPIAEPSTNDVSRIAQTVLDGTARVWGISSETAERYVTTPRPIDTLVNGANRAGKAAEVVAASDYRDLHAGRNPGIVNVPEHVAKNVADIRLSPDPASRKDLLFAFENRHGEVVWKFSGQVKTGGTSYVTDTLVEMAQTPGYGKVGYIDARLVNSDGTANVAPGAFTRGQARRLQETKVRLRGIPDLEARAEWLVNDIKAAKSDGLDPAARQQLQQLRDDIARAYSGHGVAGRIGGGAGIAAATAAVVSLVVQLTTEGKVDAGVVRQAAGTGAIFGAGGAAADSGLYHLGTKALDMAPEAAKGFARQGVAVGFCAFAIGADLITEARAVRRGNVTTTGAVGGMAAKVALDILPLVLASLGLAALPVLVGGQIGGRWLIAKAREADRLLAAAIAEDMVFADSLERRMVEFSALVDETRSNCDATDEIFRRVMGVPTLSGTPRLQLVKS